ncbi:hypothetical protein MEQU1_001501 [Malassezia equina]|uniref:Uncharacterized protein n=1 Tax=Malassezia equina TaxID=1381935 RepID=A0AAF0IYC6_9BASI|nr:hypothetical protein MEQU1_001501 [Malassezia equina]
MEHTSLEQLAVSRIVLCPSVETIRPVYPRDELWHIELDHVDQCIIATVSDGSLRTLDASSGTLLWSATLSSWPPSYGYTPFFQCSQGWISVYHRDTNQIQVWRSERTMPWVSQPQRGVFALHMRFTLQPSVMGTPVYALHYPWLSYMPSPTKLVDVNLATMQSDEYQVAMARSMQMHSVDSLERWVAFSCSTTQSLVVAQRSASMLTIQWCLEEHLRSCGAPEYYVLMPATPSLRRGFQWRPLVRIKAKRGWHKAWVSLERRQRAGWRPWQAIRLDGATDTLVALSRRGLLILLHLRECLQAGRPPRLYVIETVPSAASGNDGVPLEDWLYAPDEVGHMHMHQGRVVAMYRTLHLLDLRTRTWGQTEDGMSIQTPFTLYMWTSTPFEGCSERHEWQWTPLYHCVQMDGASIYLVTRETPPAYERGIHSRTVLTHLRMDTARPAIERVETSS